MLWKSIILQFPSVLYHKCRLCWSTNTMHAPHRTRIYLCVWPVCLIVPNNIYREGVKFTAHIPTNFNCTARSELCAQWAVCIICIEVTAPVYFLLHGPTLSSIQPFIESIEILRWLSCSCNGIALVSDHNLGHISNKYIWNMYWAIFLPWTSCSHNGIVSKLLLSLQLWYEI